MSERKPDVGQATISWNQSLDLFKKIAKAKPDIPENRGKWFWTNCPFCKGRIKFNRSPRNGHLWAKCETEKCFMAMS